MRRTFHFSNGRGLESSNCCCTAQCCGLVYSILFSLMAVVSLNVVVFAPVAIGAAARLSLCTLLSLSLLCSLLAPIAILRRSCCLLAPFIAVLMLFLALCVGLLLTTAIYVVMEEYGGEFDLQSAMDEALRSAQLSPAIVRLFGPNAVDSLSSFDRTLLFSLALALFLSFLALLIHALVVTSILWRRAFGKDFEPSDDASMEWMFTNLSASHTATVQRNPLYEAREWRRSTYVSIDNGLDTY